MLLGYAFILYLINPILGIFAFSFPAACCYQAAGAFAVIPHSKKFGGYLVVEQRNHDTSYNSILASLLSWGEGWHNYHHTKSKDYRHGHKWWELDPPAFFIERIFK
jgi:fatty-acid desaturase